MAKARILIVEAESIAARDLSTRLEALGYEVAGIAASGEEAVHLAEKTRPDAVLMDVMLRGEMSGTDAASALKAVCDCPVIFLSACSDEETLAEARLTQAFGYILKPLDDRDVRMAIEKAIGKDAVEGRLRESSQWLETTLQSIGDAVIATDGDGNVKFVNEVAAALTGWNRAEAVGRPFAEVFNIINEVTRIPAGDPAEIVLRTGKKTNLAAQTLLVSRDGRELPVEDSAAPIVDESGEVLGAVVTFRDVSQRRQADAALRASELRYRTLFESSREVLIITDLEGRIMEVNHEAGRVFGAGSEELRGRLFNRFLAEATGRELQVSIADLARRSTRPPHFEFHKGDPSARCIAFTASQVEDSRYLIVGTDVTERRRSEQERMRSLQLTQLHVEETPLGFVEVDRRGIISSWNPSARRIFGFTAEEAIGKNVMDLVSEDHLDAARTLRNELLKRDGGGRRTILQNRHKEGQEITCEWFNTLIVDEDGETVGIASLVDDVTEQFRTQRALMESEARFKAFMDNSPGSAYIKDEEGRYVYVNQALLKEYGLPAEAWLGHTDLDVFPAETAKHYRANDRRVLEERKGSRMLEISREKGRARHWLSLKFPMEFEGGELFLGGFSLDITQNKLTEDALERKVRQQSALAEISQLAVTGIPLEKLFEETVQVVARTLDIGFAKILELDQDKRFLTVTCGVGWDEELAAGAMVANVPQTHAGYTVQNEQAVVVQDLNTDDRFEGSDLLREHGIRSGLSAVIHGEDGPYGVVLAHSDSPNDFTDDDIAFLRSMANVVSAASSRKHFEDALRESEARYRTLFESIDEGFSIIQVNFDEYEKAADYRFLEVNPVFEKLSGLKDATGKTARELAPDLEDYWFEIFGEVARTGTPTRFQQRSDVLGRVFDVYAFRIGAPEERKVAILFSDVSERIGAEQERERLLREVRSEREHLAELFQQAPSFMATLLGPELVFERANRLYLQLVDRRDIIGKPVREALPEVEGQGYFEMLDRVYSTGEPVHGTDMLVKLRRKSSAGEPEERWVDFVFQPIRDASGSVAGVLIQGVDLTERKRAEIALRESETRFREITENLNEVIWTLSFETGEVLYISPSYERVWGRSTQSLYDDPASWIESIHPEDRERVLEGYRRRRESGTPFSDEYRIVRPDGEIRWIWARDHTLFDESGRPARVLGIGEEITDRKHYETELIKAKEQAEQMARLKSAFLANMSHEIRTPLTGIIGFAELVGAEVEGEARQYTSLIERSGRRLLDTLNSVLELANLESGAGGSAPRVLQVEPAVQETLDLLQPTIRNHHTVLRFDNRTKDARVKIVPSHLHRVLYNLLGNAIKFTPKGEVAVSLDADEDHVYLEVADTGVGIDKEFLPHIFDEFRQESAGMERSHEGAGLGLTITKRLVERAGGTINVESEKGEGSTFRVTLPRTMEAPQGVRLPTVTSYPQPADAASTKSILIIEDNEEARLLMRRILGKRYKVAALESPAGMLELLAGNRFDLVMLDINLGGGGSGIDLLKEIRAQEHHNAVPIVAITAYALPGDRDNFLEQGFDGYLGKPFTRRQLLETVSSLLESEEFPLD